MSQSDSQIGNINAALAGEAAATWGQSYTCVCCKSHCHMSAQGVNLEGLLFLVSVVIFCSNERQWDMNAFGVALLLRRQVVRLVLSTVPSRKGFSSGLPEWFWLASRGPPWYGSANRDLLTWASAMFTTTSTCFSQSSIWVIISLYATNSVLPNVCVSTVCYRVTVPCHCDARQLKFEHLRQAAGKGEKSKMGHGSGFRPEIQEGVPQLH